jgi:hypothetical protein
MAEPDRRARGWSGMMTHKLMNRSGLAAIAVATALTATPVLAQVADPAPVTDTTSVTPAPAPVDTPAATTTTTETTTTADPLAPVTRTRTVRTTRTATHVTAKPVARAAAPVAHVAAAAPVAAPVAAAPVAPPPADPALVAPVPETPVTATPVAPVADTSNDDILPIAGAAGLGLLALAGAGLAMRRRRRLSEEEIIEDSWTEPEMTRTVEEPVMAEPLAVEPAIEPVVAAPVAPSAFSWDKPQAATPAADGELTRTELAYQGPTPDNPSLSLKKRLKRAAFFDQREREVAAGEAVPIDPTAGLPDAVTDEFEAPATSPAPAPVGLTGQNGSQNAKVTFNRTMHPAH